MAFSENLKKLREARLFTTEYVASKIDVTEKTYIKYEEGTSMPKIEVIIKIADLFEILLDELFDREYYRNLSTLWQSVPTTDATDEVTSGYIAATTAFDMHETIESITTCTSSASDDECEVCEECKIEFEEEDTAIENTDSPCVGCTGDCCDCTCEDTCNEESTCEEECAGDECIGVTCAYASNVRCYDCTDGCNNCVVFDDYVSLNKHSAALLASICEMLPSNLSYMTNAFTIDENIVHHEINTNKYIVVCILVGAREHRFIVNKADGELFVNLRHTHESVHIDTINNVEDFYNSVPFNFNALYKIKRRMFVKY